MISAAHSHVVDSSQSRDEIRSKIRYFHLKLDTAILEHVEQTPMCTTELLKDSLSSMIFPWYSTIGTYIFLHATNVVNKSFLGPYRKTIA